MTNADRIMSLSIPEPNSGCWLWVGATKGNARLKQYGNIIVGSRRDGTRRNVSAHRLSYVTFKGETPHSADVCHKCDTPSCVNPDHLFCGSRQENVDDSVRKGRQKPQGGSQNNHAIIGEGLASEIKRMLADGVERKEIVRRTGGSVHIIKDIQRGRRWRNVVPEPPHDPA